MSVHHTARVLRHPGSYAGAAAIHASMGLWTILWKMAVVWPALMCWWLVYAMVILPGKLLWVWLADRRRPERPLEDAARANHAAMAERRRAS